MLKEHNILRIGTPEANVGFEVNWSEAEDVRDCQRIRIHVPKGKEDRTFVVKKEELHAVLFTFGNRQEQMKMIPQVESRSRHYETVLGIVAKQDIKKGEKINVAVSIPLPTFEEEIIADAKRDILKTHKGVPIIGV